MWFIFERCSEKKQRGDDMVKEAIVMRIENGMPRWFRYVERMDERRLTKQVHKVSVNGPVGSLKTADQDGDILGEVQVKITLNRCACVKNVI